MKTASFHTLGCRLNVAETAAMARIFRERGFTAAAPGAGPDVFVLNTCTVTERADRECRQLIRRVLRRSPETFVIVTGCYAQLNPSEAAAIEGVDLVLGNAAKLSPASLPAAFVKRGTPQVFVSCIGDDAECTPASSGPEDGRTRAYLKVQDGCDYQCSFCTIPRARGRSRSVPADRLVDEARRLGEAGVREIVLTGVNVGDYGRRWGGSLLDLLRRLAGVESVGRFRISSIEPNLLTPGIIDFVVSSGRFARHFHVPLQSGSTAILRAMRRRYDAQGYAALVDRIRSADPEAGIGADVIAGFPGETGDRFAETVDFIESLPISYLHVFTFSERESTDAAGLPEPVEPRERFHRSDRLRALGRRKRLEFHSRFVGRTVEVLTEENGPGAPAGGLTSNFIRVEIPAADVPANALVRVAVEGATEETCSGVLLRAEAAVA